MIKYAITYAITNYVINKKINNNFVFPNSPAQLTLDDMCLFLEAKAPLGLVRLSMSVTKKF